MSRRADKSLIKIYKDLMISKRELSDLRQSITKTLYGLKQPHSKNPASIQTRKKMCLKCKNFHDVAAAHKCKPEIFVCPYCNENFLNPDSLERHKKQVHYFCNMCFENYQESPAVHNSEMCGQRRVDCEKCGAKVKRKDIDEHVTKCCFNYCTKCKKSVYYKAYCYHLGKCIQIGEKKNRHNHDLSRTRKIVQSGGLQKSHYLPCSIVK